MLGVLHKNQGVITPGGLDKSLTQVRNVYYRLNYLILLTYVACATPTLVCAMTK